MPTVPNLDPLVHTIADVSPIPRVSPWTPSWWMRSVIQRVPETAVGWLTAQGWQVVSTYAEESCGQTFYVMARDSMNSWMVLQTVLNSYVQAYNEARRNNDLRYEDVVAMYINAITRCRLHVDKMADVSNGHVVTYLGQMEELVDSVESETATALADMTDAGTALATRLQEYLTLLNTLEGIYDTHEATAEWFLTDLGMAELARINEQFDNALAKNLQSLTDRGLYSSAIVTAITARVERERSEAITNLNDRLAREKLDNEHKLYEQEISLKGMVLDGRLKYNAGLLTKTQFMVEVRKELALTVMQARMARISGTMDIRDREEKLMAYQLDTHNNLAIGLWGFIERREDDYPSMEQITRLIAGLGDQGGGWIQP